MCTEHPTAQYPVTMATILVNRRCELPVGLKRYYCDPSALIASRMFSIDGDSSECPYSQLLRELDETYSFVLDEERNENYQRSNSVLLETLSSDDVPAPSHLRRSSSCEPRPRTVMWRDETEEFEPSSKPPRPRKNNLPKDLPESNKKSVASFKRSLRLLGLSPTDLGLSNSIDNHENCSTSTPKRRCCTPRPRLFTRLTRKSVSLDDVRKATSLMLSDADAHRVVANAVYEEWYFGKQNELLRRKRQEEEEERRKAEQKALEKEELQRKSEEKFHEWLQRKIQQKRESQIKRATSAPSPRPSYQSRLAVTPDQAAEAYYKWLEGKERQKRQNKKSAITGNRTNVRQPDPEKTKEAQKVYQRWKQEVDENMRKEQAEKRRKQQQEEMEKRKKEQEKLEDARRSFQHWKSRKEQEIRQKQENKRLTELREKERREEKKWLRSKSASKAFLEWLDAVDERSLRSASAQRNGPTVASNCRSQAAF